MTGPPAPRRTGAGTDEVFADARQRAIGGTLRAVSSWFAAQLPFVEDRIELTLPATAADLESHFPIIAAETLATSITVGPLDPTDGPFQITPVTGVGEPSPAVGR